MEAFEINEIGEVVLNLQARLRVASALAIDQPGIAKENLKLAEEVCDRIKIRIGYLIKED